MDTEENHQVLRHDPDARYTFKGEIGYKVHRLVDHKYGVILSDLATPGNLADPIVVPDILRTFRQRFKIRHDCLAADSIYKDQAVLAYVDWMGYDVYVPIAKNVHPQKGMYGAEHFKYDPEQNILICPAGKELKFRRRRPDKGVDEFKAKATDCNRCLQKYKCTNSNKGRTSSILINEALILRISERCKTRKYKSLMAMRKIFSEGSFGEAKTLCGMDEAKLRGLENMNIQSLLTSTVQNIKKFIKYAKGPKTTANKLAKTVKEMVYSFISLVVEGRMRVLFT